jgi:hypothetical protein
VDPDIAGIVPGPQPRDEVAVPEAPPGLEPKVEPQA